MPTAPNTNPSPAPEGSNPAPELSVVPPPEGQTRERSFLNQRQEEDVRNAKLIALAAQEPAHAGVLDDRGVTPVFVAAVLTDIETALNHSSMAACYTDRKEGCTQSEQDAAQSLKKVHLELETRLRKQRHD